MKPMLRFLGLMGVMLGFMMWSLPGLAQDLGPYEKDANTIVLLHFDGDLTNDSDIAPDAESQGRFQFLESAIPYSADFDTALYIINDGPTDSSQITVDHVPAMNVEEVGDGDFTLEGWISPINFPAAQYDYILHNIPLITKGLVMEGARGMQELCYGVALNGYVSTLTPFLAYNNGHRDMSPFNASDNIVALNEWIHFAFVRDKDQRTAAIILHDANGNHLETTAIVTDSDPISSWETPFTIASRDWSYSEFERYNGLVDEVRLSNVIRDYSVPPAIANVETNYGGANGLANQPVEITSEIRTLGNNTLDAVELHYSLDGGGSFNSVVMNRSSDSTFVGNIPAQSAGTIASYYIKATNVNGDVTLYPSSAEDATNPGYLGVGFWDPTISLQTLGMPFDESLEDTTSFYTHMFESYGENVEFSTDVAPGASGTHSLAINMNSGLPDTAFAEIPFPTNFLNPGAEGFTVDFWIKIDSSSYYRANDILDGNGWLIYSSIEEGNFTFSLDTEAGEIRFNAGTGLYSMPNNWFRLKAGATSEYAFFELRDANDSLLSRQTNPLNLVGGEVVSDNSLPSGSGSYELFLERRADSESGGTKGYIDNLTYYNYPKAVPPIFLATPAIGTQPENKPVEVSATVTTPGTEVSQAQVFYRLQGGTDEFTSVDMSNEGGGMYTGIIPGQSMGDVVEYYLIIETENGFALEYPENAVADSNYASFTFWIPMTQTLKLWFEEPSGTTPIDSSTYELEPVVNGDLVYSNDVAPAAEGSQSIVFDGNTNYLAVEPGYFLIADNFTYDFWFKTDSAVGDWIRVVAKDGEDTWHEAGFNLLFRNPDASLAARSYFRTPSGGLALKEVLFETDWSVGEWYRLHYEVATDTMFAQLYNGNNDLLEEGGHHLAPEDGRPLQDNGPLLLGACRSGERKWPGKIDNFQFYNYSVTYPKDTTSVKVNDDLSLPKQVTLSQNYPNPFNPATQINYAIPNAQEVTLVVYDLLGRKVNTLVNKMVKPGTYSLTWNGEDEHGRRVASGVYFYRLQTEKVTKVRKMVLMR